MSKVTSVYVIAFAVFISVVSVFGGVLYIISSSYRDCIVDSGEQIIEILELEFNVVDGIVQSPSVIIRLEESVESFVEKGLELGAETVYKSGNYFYIFNSDLTIAWRYGVKTRYCGFLGLFSEWVNP